MRTTQLKLITNVQEEAQEVFGILILNTKNKIVAVHEISRGTLEQLLWSIHEKYSSQQYFIMQRLLYVFTTTPAVIQPKRIDIKITKRLSEAGKILGIEIWTIS
jgi:DNA repair protein RadC